MSITLYQAPISNHANLVNFFLAASGIGADKVKSVTLDLAKGEHKAPDFLKINPSGQIPSLVSADGASTYESGAILRYLASKFDSPLYPVKGDAEKLAAIDTAYEYVRNKLWGESSGYIFNKKFAPLFGREPNQERIKDCEGVLDKQLKHIAETWFKGSNGWMVGDAISVADTTLGVLLTHTTWAGYEIKEAKLTDFVEKIRKESWYQETGFNQFTKSQ